MALNLYRRHRRDCKAAHPEEYLSSEFEERKRSWKRCECPIFASGTLGDRYREKSTGAWEWAHAKGVAAMWDATDSWDGKVAPKREPIPDPAQPKRIGVSHACETFLSELEETAAFATHKQYRLMLKSRRAFSEQRGYMMIDRWEPVDVRQFRST